MVNNHVVCQDCGNVWLWHPDDQESGPCKCPSCGSLKQLWKVKRRMVEIPIGGTDRVFYKSKTKW